MEKFLQNYMTHMQIQPKGREGVWFVWRALRTQGRLLIANSTCGKFCSVQECHYLIPIVCLLG